MSGVAISPADEPFVRKILRVYPIQGTTVVVVRCLLDCTHIGHWVGPLPDADRKMVCETCRKLAMRKEDA